LAAFLSFLWPGLGQLYAGRRRLAAVFAVPVLLVLLLALYQLRRGVVVFAAMFVQPSFAFGALVLVVLLGFWRIAAVSQAHLSDGAPRGGQIAGRSIAAALVAIIVLTHSVAGYMLWITYSADTQAFAPNTSLIDQATPGPTLAPGATATITPSTPPPATPPPMDSRVTILFTGVDAAPGRGERLYDSIMVVSYDPVTNSSQMVSVPRDTASFPLYYGGQVSATVRINSLPTYVMHGWVSSPDDPYTTLVKEVSYLVGIPINYYAVMDLGGFVKMVDTVGGIDVNNPNDINDPVYDWLGAKPGSGFTLSAGPHHLDGVDALAYVRSRHGSNNSDWVRASRQQEVLMDLLHAMAHPDKLLALPALISTMGSSLATNFPSDRVADYVAAAEAIPPTNFKSVVLGPPYSIITTQPTMSTTCLLNYKVAQMSVDFFGKDSLWYGKKLPVNTCPS
jgi:polyisoprenyl-teichoic acid--peptidoglycan teichoic acid transferase